MNNIKPGLFAVVAATAIFASAAGLDVRAKEKEASMELRAVMDQLGRDMQAAAGAISKEDWAQVRIVSSRIARHSEPSALEKVRILKWMGSDAGRFRAFDAEMKQGANDMAAAAGRSDGPRVIRSFSEVQSTCLGCHQQFRAPFVQHFYGRR